MDNDAYPETLPQALKLLEQFKPEAIADAATGDPTGDSGVAFAQTKGHMPTRFKCGMKGHTVDDCSKLDTMGRDKFWADRKAACELLPQRLHPLLVSLAI
mmetsp:Transcript_35164/g.35376  ORF Transcript_35164/g.35376 Transcript_35164/m.35376 type:complete len:100 (+) Transcript_35164:378-677(+)